MEKRRRRRRFTFKIARNEICLSSQEEEGRGREGGRRRGRGEKWWLEGG